MSDSDPAPPERVVAAALHLWSAAGAQHVLAVEGPSMLPLIRSGDELVLQHGPNAGLRRGDIVVFRQCERVLAHRVLRLEAARLLTMGDNAPEPDAPVLAGEIIGRVLAIRRVDRTRSLQGRAALAGARLCALALWGWVCLLGTAPRSRLRAIALRAVRAFVRLVHQATRVL